jgi:cytochrome c-type biogenesis protein CcmH
VRILSLCLILLITAVSLGAQEAQEPASPDPRTVVGAPRGSAPAGAALEAEAERVAGLLRCPVCQGLSVKDSPTGMAVNMRQQVREMVAAGYDEEQILSYFEKSYGEFVRLRPKLTGFNWLVWVGPLAALIVGGLVVRRVLRRGQAAAPRVESAPSTAGENVPRRDTLPEDAALARHVLRAREIAYGWPGGVPPTSDAGAAEEKK